MLDEQYSWSCPKCGEKLKAIGPASLDFIKRNHEYWEHTRKEREFANGGYIGNPAPVAACDFVPPILYSGRAIFDDAFWDGARLSRQDRSFLKLAKVEWT